jgi:hypothetical protein
VQFNECRKTYGLDKFRPMDETRDNPGVIAPPPDRADDRSPRFGARLVSIVLYTAGYFRLLDTLDRRRDPHGIGAALAIVAVRNFSRAGTNVEPWKPALTLVTGGIFDWMRNPMYVAPVLIVAGIAVAFGSDWTLVLLVPAALVMHFGVVKREERYLAGKFGGTYDDYMRRVPRYGVRFARKSA